MSPHECTNHIILDSASYLHVYVKFGSRCSSRIASSIAAPLKCVLLLTPDVVPFCVSFPIRGGAVPGEDPACAALASLFFELTTAGKRILQRI